MATTWQEGSKLTAKGLALQSKPLAGKKFAFTRAAMSSVYVPPEDQEALTDLPDHKQDLYLQPVTLNADGTATLLILLTNDDVTTSYTAHTIGIYAQDPDEGEILYATMTDETGDVIPTFQEAPNSSIDWNTTIGYGNATEVIIQREPNSYVSLAVANQLIEEHNTSATAHTDLFKAKADLVSGKIPTSQIPTLDYIPTSEKGAANGVAGLDANQKILMDNIPDALLGSLNYRGTWDASTGLDDTGTAIPSPDDTNKGYYWITTTAGTYNSIDFAVQDWLISNGTQYDKVVNSNAVSSVNGKTGAVVLGASDVGAVPASQIVITDVEPEEGGASTLDENTLIFVYEV